MRISGTAWRRLAASAALVLVLGACTSGGTPSTSTSPASAEAFSASPSSASFVPSASGLTADGAARLVLASNARFSSIEARDPSLVGQASWYEVTPTAAGFTVVIRIGWGDCPSGCIDEHRWTYEVSAAGHLQLIGESGPAVPAASGDSPGLGTVPPSPRPTPAPTPRPTATSVSRTTAPAVTVKGQATAGPICPVERVPPDPSCAPRPVAGAVLEVTRDGSHVTTVTTDSNGDFSVSLEPGSYTLVPQPVAGLMRVAPPISFTVPSSGAPPFLEVQYDTGIR